MASNTNLTRDLAISLIKGQAVTCPCCQKATLVSRYSHKSQRTEYKCPNCGEIYHPSKFI